MLFSRQVFRGRRVKGAIAALAVASIAVLGATVPTQSAEASTNDPGAFSYAGLTTNFYAYIRAGEHLTVNVASDTSLNVQPTGTFSGTVTSPDGQVFTFDQGQLASGQVLPAATADGIWTINIPPVTGMIGNDPASLAQGASYTWEIDVKDASNATITGRVWTPQNQILQGSTQRDFTLERWFVNTTGYIYKYDAYNFNGINSRISADQLGLTDANCNPGYRSQEAAPTSEYKMNTSCAAQFHQFFEAPDPSLPTTATIWDGTASVSTWVVPTPLAAGDLTIDDLTFVPTSKGSAAGAISYQLPEGFTGGYLLQVDVDGDGNFGGPLDRTIRLGEVTPAKDVATYAFDGKDAAGNVIPDWQKMNIRVSVDRIGEIHLVLNDVEMRAGGVTISRLNGPADGRTEIYWNDTYLAPVQFDGNPITGFLPTTLDGTAGADSSTPVHSWGPVPLVGSDIKGSWGDHRLIDDWTYVPMNAQAQISVSGQHSVVVKSSNFAANMSAGARVTYTVDATADGSSPYTAADPMVWNDDLTAVVDDASLDTASPKATYVGGTNDGSDAGVVAWDSSTHQLSWSGPLEVDQTVRFTYDVLLTKTGDGVLRNVTWTEGGDVPTCDTTDGTDPVTGQSCAVVVDNDPRVVVAKTSNPVSGSTVAIGDVVTYTVSVTNPTLVDATPTITDDLSKVLDAATLTTAPASANAAVQPTFAGSTVTWSPVVPASSTVTMTYSVTVKSDLSASDMKLDNVVTSPNTNCAVGSTDPTCSTEHLVPNFVVSKKTDKTGTVSPGDTITYTITGTNNGTGTSTFGLTDSLVDVLDDAELVTAPALAAGSPGTLSYDAATSSMAWSGPLDPAQSVTITYQVRVLDPATNANASADQDLLNTVVSTTPSNCDAGSTDPDCTTDNKVAAMHIVKTSDPASGSVVLPGDTVTYHVTATNSGAAALVGATFTDDMSEVLDDATIASAPVIDASGPGSVSYVDGATSLTWSGDLAAGQSVTVTYSVTVKSADRGDSSLVNVVTSTTPGNNCVEGSADPDCSTNHLVGELHIVKTSDPEDGSTVVPGGIVNYTITATNSGAADLSDANFTDDLADVLGAAAVTTAPVASSGTVEYVSGGSSFTWNGSLAAGASVTVTYSVTVLPNGGTGDLLNVVTSTTPGNNCPDDSTDPDCSTDHKVAAMHIVKTSDPASGSVVMPGDTITYHVTATNTGKAILAGASFTDDMSAVLDDATLSSAPAIDAGGPGVVNYVNGATSLAWAGDLAPGQSVTVSYSVKVKDLTSDRGDNALVNVVTSNVPGNNCLPDSNDPDCSTNNKIDGLNIVKTSDPAPGSVVLPGAVVNYTITATNTGATDLADANFTDDLAGVLGAATVTTAPTASSGTVGYTDGASSFTWNGPLNVGESVTVTYSVTVMDNGGNGDLLNVVTSTTPGNNCLPDSNDPDCSTDHKVPGVKIVKVADHNGSVAAGDIVKYTITICNEGAIAYPGFTITDDMSGVLDDASYLGDAAADSGVVSYSAPKLSWVGDVAVGQKVTITYSVRVSDPATSGGDHLLDNVVIAKAETGANCQAGSTDVNCSTHNQVGTFQLPSTGFNVSVLYIAFATFAIGAAGLLTAAKRRRRQASK